MTDSLIHPSDTPPLRVPCDADGRIAIDVACLRCRYNLRSLFPDARCPECGDPAASSLRGFYLFMADPVWVRKLAHGATLILFTALIGFALFFFSFILAALIRDELPAACMLILIPVGAILYMAGLVRISTPEPTDTGAPGRIARRFVRACVWLVLVPFVTGAAAYLILEAIEYSRGDSLIWNIGFTLGMIAYISSLLIIFIIPPALARHVSNLMARIPRPGLSRMANTVFWINVALAALALVGIAAVFIVSITAAATTTTTFAAPASAPATLGYVSYSGSATVTINGNVVAQDRFGITSASATTQPVAPTSQVAFTPPMRSSANWFRLMMIAFTVTSCGTALSNLAGCILLFFVRRELLAAATAHRLPFTKPDPPPPAQP